MGEMLRVKNWDKFQHYKNRDPAWIKLHVNILIDRKFSMLNQAQRGLLMQIWVLASENRGELEFDIEEIRFRLHDATIKVEQVETLIHKGFLKYCKQPLDGCKQLLFRERERVRVRERLIHDPDSKEEQEVCQREENPDRVFNLNPEPNLGEDPTGVLMEVCSEVLPSMKLSISQAGKWAYRFIPQVENDSELVKLIDDYIRVIADQKPKKPAAYIEKTLDNAVQFINENQPRDPGLEELEMLAAELEGEK